MLSREQIFEVEFEKRVKLFDYKKEGFDSQEDLEKAIRRNILNRFNKIKKQYEV